MADSLIGIDRDSLGKSGQSRYDDLTDEIYPSACETNFATGSEALSAGNYQGAVDALYKVVRMNAEYNDGQALFNLAQAYMGNGDNDNAVKYFQRVVDDYGDSEYAEEAQTNLDTLSAAADDSGDDSSGDDTSGGDGGQ